MTDPRHRELARLLTDYSLSLQPGEKVLIHACDIPDEFVIELMRSVREARAIPFVETQSSRIVRELQRGASEEQCRMDGNLELHRIRKMDAYIAVRGAHNTSETSDVPEEQRSLVARLSRAARNHRVDRTRWCVLRWPTPSMAQAAGMSTEAFEDFFFDVCTLDYARMARAMEPLARRMRAADRVRLEAPGTDLEFSIEGIDAQACRGDRNIPDGEVMTAPVRTSVNGVIRFNTPTLHSGTRFERVELELEKGRIVRATSSDSDKLNRILDTDPGARYIGEFSLGFHPGILDPMGDILFDEKIAGSLHFTPGQAYKECDNGNRSAVHWDMVLIQRPEWGGGKVWFDRTLIRDDGIFLPRDLRGLNPENLR